MVEGISHLTFIVRDLDRMEKILVTVLDAKKVYDSGDATFSHSKERFFLVAGIWVAAMEGDALSTRTYNHVAFKIKDLKYDESLEKIRDLGLHTLDDRPRVMGEARSIYFYDDDNHLFELHTGNLEERLKRYGKPAIES